MFNIHLPGQYQAQVDQQFGRPEVIEHAHPRRSVGIPEHSGDDGPSFEILDGACSGNNSKHPLQESGRPFNDRARKVVLLYTDCFEFICSGTMVDDRHVLTAGHCITHADGAYLDASRMMFCSYGNSTSAAASASEISCRSFGWLHVNADRLAGDTSVASDYGIATLTNVLEGEERLGWMALASTDATLMSHTDNLRGYPSTDLDCNNANASDPYWGVRTSACKRRLDSGRVQYFSSGPMKTVTLDKILAHNSSKHGMSGGPHYYCPTGECDEGHYLTGVHHAHSDQHTSAKNAVYIRSWVASYAFNYE